MEDDKLENDEKIEERSSDDDEIEEGGSLGLFVKKSKGKKKKCGRKSPWTSEDIDDFIDIVVSNTYYKRKLIFTNTKCQRNREIYAEILTELKKRATARGTELEFTVKQNVLVTANKQHSPYEQPQGSRDSRKTEGLETGLRLFLQWFRQGILVNQIKP